MKYVSPHVYPLRYRFTVLNVLYAWFIIGAVFGLAELPSDAFIDGLV